MKANCIRLLIAMATFILGCFINTISANENMLVINAASEKPLVQKVTYKPDNEGLSVRYVINSLRISDNSLIIEGLSVCDFKENNCCQREDIIFVPDDMDAIVTFRPASMKTIDVASKKLVVNSEPKTLKTTDSELSNCTYSEFHYRGHKFLRVNVCPVIKNSENIVSLFDDLTYDVTFTPRKNSEANEWLKPIDVESDALIAMTLNKETVINSFHLPGSSVGLPVQDVLLLTHQDLVLSANKFAKFRSLFGFNISIISQERWDSATVDNAIKEWYKSSSFPYAIIIIGSNDLVPASYSDYAPNITTANDASLAGHITDIPYACMSKNQKDCILDVSIGRFPVNTTAELHLIISKIIDYETNPTTNPEYYQTALVAGDFFPYKEGDKTFYTIEANSQGITSCERIYHKFMSNGLNCNYLYSSSYEVAKPIYNSKKFSLRDEILYPNYEWHNNKSYEFTKLIAENNIFIEYNGHGNENGWRIPRLTTNEVTQTSSTDGYSLVVSSACNTGDFSKSNSFAEAYFKNPYRGSCIAIFAPTGISTAPSNNLFGEGIVDALWTESPIRSYSTFETQAKQPVYSLGELLKLGLFRMDYLSNIENVADYNSQLKRYMRELIHLFGDPTLNIRVNQPKGSITPQITKNENTIYVFGCPENSTIVLFDTSNNHLYKYKGVYAQLSTTHSKDFVVCVSSTDYTPYIEFDGKFTIQNETISGRFSDTGYLNINLGSNVDNNKESGPVYFKDNADITIGSSEGIVIEPSVIIEQNASVNFVITKASN